jgi:3-methyl-2-oxobutanoate hydroxymethyltransferase
VKRIKLILKKRPLVCLTANNIYTAEILDNFCDIILVGDSLGMVVYGENTTSKVTLDMMIGHGKAVRKGIKKSIMVVDMPKGTYEKSSLLALKNAKKIRKLTRCDALKLEGGTEIIKSIKILKKNNIPVMSHIGLQPQKISNKKKFRVLGKKKVEEKKVINDLISVEKAGSFAVVLESVTLNLTKKINKISKIPVIGIGASKNCDGQILVTEDLLGLFEKSPKFVKRYENLRYKIKIAAKKYRNEVIKGIFPGKNNIYN